jgi:ATP-dependent exoDNAse (exonuclease V) beta subunit
MSEEVRSHESHRLDELARSQALDPERSIVLQAPAGSGKTTVLTQRFLRLLCTVDEPEQVLAITFTRKAAAEMRERIIRALRGESDAAAAHATALGGFAAAAAARSRARGWSLEESPARLRIQTIDSLSRWLAEQRPIAARGAGEAQVVERPLTLYRMAARRTLIDADSDEGLRPDADLLFERLDNDFARFEDLLTEMLQHRAHWLPRLLWGGDNEREEADLCARVTESLQAIVGERLRNVRTVLPRALIAEGATIAREVAARRAAAGDSGGHASVWNDPALAAEELTLAHWQSLARLALTEQGNFRLNLTRREGFDDAALKGRAATWLDSLARVPGARELLAEIAMLPLPRLTPDDAAALSALARLLRLAAAELEVVFQESSRVDFAHVSAAARHALTEGGAPTDLALRLGSDIRHILVDEFQDTSIEQFALLESLTAAWEPGDGRTLFVVGDPMQSIYQFREAEVGLFLRTQQRGLGALRLTPLSLTRNFRAAPGLIDWTNDVFARCFPELDNPRTSAVRYTACISGLGGAERGAVHLNATPTGDPGSEALAVAELVTRLKQAEPGCSIAVLLSSRSHAAPIVQALERAGIRVSGVDLVALADLPVVRDLAALTRALDHLGDRTAWLAVLRAPWCGLTLSELGALTETAPGTTVWDLMNDEARVASLPGAARARLLRVREALGRSLAERERCDLSRWVENAWLRLGGPAACASDEDLGHARAFFDGLARWSTEPGWGGPPTLEESLAELYASHDATPEDAVQIMTIHRAKGLEFDKVILPGLGRKLRANPEPLLRWLELPRDPDGSDLLMAAIPPRVRRGSDPLGRYLKSLKARRAAHERVRLAYVAATRARSELHLFAEPPSANGVGARAEPHSGTLLAALWPALSASFPRAEPAPAVSVGVPAIGARASAALTRLPPDWSLPLPRADATLAGMGIASYEPAPDAPSLEATATLEQCAVLAVSDQLRQAARLGRLPPRGAVATVHALSARLARLGLTGMELAGATERAAELFEVCLADPKVQWIFLPDHARAESSLALSGVIEGRLESVCVDRTFVDAAGMRWLIDFKPGVPLGAAGESFLASEMERHRIGIERSLVLARRLGPEPLRAAIYFPGLTAWRELTGSPSVRSLE